MLNTVERPQLIGSLMCEETEAEWPLAALVAAVLGITVAVVVYICSVCEARSFDACVSAVQNY